MSLRFWRMWGQQHVPNLILSGVFMALVAATTAGYALLIKWVYDRFETGGDVTSFVIPLVIGVTALRGISLYLQAVLTHRVVLGMLRDVQSALFEHLQRADLAQLSQFAPSALASRFSNDMTLLRESLMRCTTAARDVMQVVALVSTMFYFDWLLSILVLVVYPIAGQPIFRIGKRLRRASGDMQAQVGQMTAFVSENLSGARMVKTYQLEDNERDRAQSQFQQLHDLNLGIVKHRARLDPIMEVIGGFAVGGVIAAGGWRIASGATSVGDLTAFIASLLLAAPAVRAIGTINNVLQEGFAALDRVFTLLDEPPRIVDAPDAKSLQLSHGKIELIHVDFGYETGERVLNDLSLLVDPGTTVALVGPSGAGKSTVLNLLPRLYDADKGQVLIDGQDVKNVTLESLRAEMALVSQDIILFNDTVRKNIAFGRLDATDEEIENAAKAAAAHEFIELLPNGYDTIVGDRGMKLSGGQRQRISIARAILRDPKILLLDEATSSLDAESEIRIQEALDRLKAGRTTLVIAHRLSTVQDADQIYVMVDGQVVEEGKHGELITAEGQYARLANLQFRNPLEN